MSSLLFLLLTSVVVDVSLSNGQATRGQLKSLSTDMVEVEVDGEVQRLSRSGVKRLKFPAPGAAEGSPLLFVQLTDDSVLTGKSVQMNEKMLTANEGAQSWEAKVDTVRAIRWQTAGEKTDEQWNEILSKAASEDLLVIRRDAGLDYLRGVVDWINSETVQFQYSGNSIPVPLKRVAGVILARKEVDRPLPRLQMTTTDGGRWMLKAIELKGAEVLLTTMAGVERKIPIDGVDSISYPQLGAVFLTDLEPTQVKHQPYFDSKLNETLAALQTPRYDQSYSGDALRVSAKKSATGWRQFRRGLAVQSRTEMTYRLAGKYQRFMATAGVGPDSPSQTDIQLKLFSDDREVYSTQLKSADEPMEIDIDVSSTARLKLLVDYGENIHVGDRIHLGDARLIK